MKITYNIKFKVNPNVVTLLHNVEDALVDTPFGRLFGRLFFGRTGTNFISDNDVRHALKELVGKGTCLVLVDDACPGIPYIREDGSIGFYLQPDGSTIVDAGVVLNEYDGKMLTLEVAGKLLFFIGWPGVASPVYYSPGKAMDPHCEASAGKIHEDTWSDSRALIRLFIRMLGTALKSAPDEGKPTESVASGPAESGNAGTKETPDDAQPSIPNHLLHGHDGDPLIHPPVARKPAEIVPPVPVRVAGVESDDANDPMESPNYVDPMKDATLVEPKPAKEDYPVKREDVYRAAALALSKLNLVAVIKGQRAMFPDSEYWTNITRSRLYPDLMEELMAHCDFICGQLQQGNGPFLDNKPVKWDDGDNSLLGESRRPFEITMHAYSDVPGRAMNRCLFNISYKPISSSISLELNK